MPTVQLFSTLRRDAILAARAARRGITADGTTARHVTVNLTADAPLLFWSLLVSGTEPQDQHRGRRRGGRERALCTACGIEPFAIRGAEPGGSDGLRIRRRHASIRSASTAPAEPALLAGTTGPRFKYLIIDRYNTGSTFAEDQQLFRTGAQGLPSTTPNITPCSTIGTHGEHLGHDRHAAQACAAAALPTRRCECACAASAARLTTPRSPPAVPGITDVATIATAYTQDTDLDRSQTTTPSYTGRQPARA